MPLVIHLGDFLQLRPTAGLSLLEDMDAIARDREEDVPAEFQAAAKLFLRTRLCYELSGTNRFRSDAGGRDLKELIAFMRAPTAETTPEYERARGLWDSIRLDSSHDQVDARLRESRFQEGHMLGIYWETVAPWAVQRARRDARALQTPLFLLQAADHASPPLPKAVAAKLMNHYNPLETGGIHGIFPAHLGMSVRLTDSICKEKGLVKDSSGVIVRIEFDPRDDDLVKEAFLRRGDDASATVYPRHMPLGLWLRMDKYDEAPFAEKLVSETSLNTEAANSLLLLSPTTTLMPFSWREYKVTRSGFPLAHGMVRTSTACQGKTFEQGVLIDCARRDTGQYVLDEGDWWLHLYVMLSRATSLKDIVLVRAPEASWLLHGPPTNLRQRLQVFRSRVGVCHATAEVQARELGLASFLR